MRQAGSLPDRRRKCLTGYAIIGFMSKRPRDTNRLAKRIVDISTGEIEESPEESGKDPNAVALGRKGGLKGGKARADKLTAEERSEIAKKAAAARWRVASKGTSKK